MGDLTRPGSWPSVETRWLNIRWGTPMDILEIMSKIHERDGLIFKLKEAKLVL